jgi:hypothetical protein
LHFVFGEAMIFDGEEADGFGRRAELCGNLVDAMLEVLKRYLPSNSQY